MTRTSDDLGAALVGAGAGLAATAAMSALMLAAQRAGVMGRLPPHRIADVSVERSPADDAVGREGRGALGWLLHFAFGAAAGGLYAVLHRRVDPPTPDPLDGVGFGLAVWTVSYMGWVPALGFLPPATEDRPGRPPAMIAAHVVFGAVLAAIVAQARSTDRA
jgi:hypothetical protein